VIGSCIGGNRQRQRQSGEEDVEERLHETLGAYRYSPKPTMGGNDRKKGAGELVYKSLEDLVGNYFVPCVCLQKL